MPFEEFHSNRARRGVPMISIVKDGHISLNKACLSEYFKSCEHVILMFDKAESKIGIKPIDENEARTKSNTHQIHRKKGGYAKIGVVAFLKFSGYQIGEAKTYVCHWNKEEELINISIN